ncbi:MAG: hypothetical protein ACE5I1_32135 [bacterium]
MWANAFLQQAQSDWQMWQHIRDQKLPACHALHYLQMTSEKLGKAFLIAGGNITPQKAAASHVAFTRFLQVASRNPALQKLLHMTPKQLRAHIKSMLPIAESIERLTPSLAKGGPNVEYPWESPDKSIQIPVNYTFPAILKFRESPGMNLLKMVNIVQEHFYHLFTKSHKPTAQN